MNAAALAEADLISIDPRPCELCGRTIDQHECFDGGEGPEFFCAEIDDGPPPWFTESIMRQWELADPRDAWRHTGEPPPPASVRNSDVAEEPAARSHYRTPQATTDAFWFVINLCDPARLKAWLHDHPRDARHLLKLLESK
jgi:hypothetical protein